MKVDIVDIDALVEVNQLPRVTNTILIERPGYPTQDGLHQFELFGRISSEKRRFQFGYVDLKRRFLHPVVYLIIARSEQRLLDVINGTRDVSIDKDGNIYDDINGSTGIQFLYDNWEKINWKENDSAERSNKLLLIKNLKKNEAFCSKWVTIPPFYRDLNLRDGGQGAQSTDEITPLYQKLIGLSNSIDDSEFDLGLGNNTERKIQEIIVEIYEILTSKLAKKNGVVHPLYSNVY